MTAWIAVTSVWKSFVSWLIDTFMTAVSSTITNWAAPRAARARHFFTGRSSRAAAPSSQGRSVRGGVSGAIPHSGRYGDRAERSHVPVTPDEPQREEAGDGRQEERGRAEREHRGERGIGWDAERGEAARERGLLHADAAGHGRHVAEHACADLHDDQLREPQRLSEREEAQPEQGRVDEVAGRVTPEEQRALLRVAHDRPHVARGALDRRNHLAPDLRDEQDDTDERAAHRDRAEPDAPTAVRRRDRR